MNLDLTDLIQVVENLTSSERAEFIQLANTLDRAKKYQLDPLSWIEEVLGIKKETIKWSLNPGYEDTSKPRYIDEELTLENWWDGTPDPIEKIFISLANWKNVAVESSTGTGKSFAAALAILWFLDVFPDCQVRVFAPTKPHIQKNLWKNVRIFEDKFLEIRPEAEFLSLSIRIGKGNENWQANGMVAAVGASETVSSKAAGVHAEHMLFVFDETQGIDPAILAAVENTCTSPHNLILALGNPSGESDELHRLFTKNTFESIRVSSYDHPNLVMNDREKDWRFHKMLIPGAVSWKSIFERRELYGIEPEYYNEHPIFKSHVRGICPTGGVYSLFNENILTSVSLWFDENVPEPIYQKEIKQRLEDQKLEGFVRTFVEIETSHINRYVFFCDVAEDSGYGDWHVCTVFDRITKGIVSTIRMRGHRDEFVNEILELAEMYKVYNWEQDRMHYPVINWERNAGGALHLVKKFSLYPELYIHRVTDKPGRIELHKTQKGWWTGPKTRNDMINELSLWGKSLINNPERVQDYRYYEEMKTFSWNENKKRYEHITGAYDDCMMSLAGSNHY